MNWNEAAHLLNIEGIKFGGEQIPLRDIGASGPSGGQKICDLDADTRQSLDAAVRFFTRHRLWPDLSKYEITVLLYRLAWGAEVCLLMGQAQYSAVGKWLARQPPEDMAEEDLLEWLLIDTWHQSGHRLCMNVANIVCGPLRV